MKNIKFIFQSVEISTIQITFLALLWWVIGCHSASVDDQNINDLITDPDVEIVDSVVISRIDSLGLMYRIISPLMVRSFHNRTYNEEHPKGFEVIFYDNQQETESSVSAGYANIDDQYLANLRDDVIIKSEKGDVLETTQITWDILHRKLDTDKLIRLIEASGDTTYGFGLVANEDFSRFTIKRGFAGKRQFRNIRDRLKLGE